MLDLYVDSGWMDKQGLWWAEEERVEENDIELGCRSQESIVEISTGWRGIVEQ